MNQYQAQFRPPAVKDSLFITFEGIEGAGKSTQIKKLDHFFQDSGYRTIHLREPGGTPFGEALRAAILQSETPLHPMAEAHLFASSRAQLLKEVILKELEQPKTVVICDRYIDSSLAYQGTARGLGQETILELHKNTPLNTLPHKTIYIRIGLETSLERQMVRNQKKDYFESQNRDFYQKLIEGYDEAAKRFPQRIATVDGERDIDKIYADIITIVKELV